MICVSVVACSAEKKVVLDPSMSGVVPPGDILTGRAAEMKHEFFQINTPRPPWLQWFTKICITLKLKLRCLPVIWLKVEGMTFKCTS